MRIAIVGGGPGRALLRRADEAARPRPTRSPSGSATRRTTPSASAWCSPTRPSAASRAPTPGRLPADGEPVRPLDRHRHRLQRPGSFTVGGQGFAAMSRKELLRILQRAGAPTSASPSTTAREAPDPDELRASHDLVVAADGLNSADPGAATPTCSGRRWTAGTTSTSGSAPTWSSRRSSSSSSRRSGAPCRSTATPTPTPGSTFIVEMHEDVWRRAGFDAHRGTRPSRPAPPTSTPSSGSARSSPTSCRGTRSSPTTPSGSASPPSATSAGTTATSCCSGDAAHTAHFSIGSGTKLAMEDALALAACLHEQPTVEAALEAYEAERRPVVESTQRAAQASLEWFENIGMYADQEPAQFVFNLLTRSRRITFENLRDRDPEFAEPDGGGVRPPPGRRRGRAGDVPAGPDRRAGAEEPGHRLPDGHVLAPSTACPATSTWSTSAPRRSAAPAW